MRLRRVAAAHLRGSEPKRFLNRRSRIARRHFAATMVGVTLSVLASIGGTPALAAGSNIEFSTDGVNYSAGLSGSLFRDIARMVPGDSQTSTFWIRNGADSAGFLRLVLSDVTSSDPALAHALSLRVRTDSLIDQRITIDKASPCWVLVDDILNRGASVKMTVTMTLGGLNGTDGQNANASFALRAGLRDVAAGSIPPSSCDGTSTGIDGTGPVPLSPPPAPAPAPAPTNTSHPSGVAGSPAVIAFTGSELPYPLLIAGAGALGVGLFLLIAARRRRREGA